MKRQNAIARAAVAGASGGDDDDSARLHRLPQDGCEAANDIVFLVERRNDDVNSRFAPVVLRGHSGSAVRSTPDAGT